MTRKTNKVLKDKKKPSVPRKKKHARKPKEVEIDSVYEGNGDLTSHEPLDRRICRS